jgi:HlyD family secretion protein
VIVGIGALLLKNRGGKPTAQASSASPQTPGTAVLGVGCTGRVEPEGGFSVIAAELALGRTPVIAKLFVKEGQLIAPGEIIATLESLPDLESAVKQADARVSVAQNRLAQLEAGARPGDVLALQSDIARLESEAKAAKQELDREQALAQKDFVPRVRVDAARLKSEDAQRLFEAARDRLESLTQIRDSDVNLAKAEIASAIADRDRACIEERAGTVRSPVRGSVIQIISRPGEAVGPGGVVTIADTTRMEVIAEVYETDIARVHPGQKAVISSESLPGAISGVVSWISPQIESLDLPVAPSAPPEQRVYQARIKVDRPEVLARRIHSKVNVRIEP